MADGRFCHYELRTQDVVSAGAFYSDLFGAAFWCEQVTMPIAVPARTTTPVRIDAGFTGWCS